MDQRISTFLKEREEKDLLRSLERVSCPGSGRIRIEGREYVNFSSNDYLGLASHPSILEEAKKNLSEVFGSSASRLMAGSFNLHHELEERTASFKGKPSALVFNSGYQANVGIISALFSKRDAVFSDKLNHASVIDGIRLSGARFFRFRHNDTAHLEEMLDRERDNFDRVLIVTETVFSMDGDKAPLMRLAELKGKYDCMFMVDEAHATGIFGEKGSGLCEEAGVTDSVDIIMGTFSKALGGFGAYAATSRELRDYLINTCRSFIYSTALPQAVVAADLAAVDVVENEPYRRRELLENAEYLRNALRKRGFDVRGTSQIVPIITGDNEGALRFSGKLKEKGYWALPVRPPTVPEGASRTRISLSYDHSREVLERFIDDCVQAYK